jgi:hypothetical protein
VRILALPPLRPHQPSASSSVKWDRKPSAVEHTCSFSYLRLRWEDYLRSGVQDQPGQHSKTLHLKSNGDTLGPISIWNESICLWLSTGPDLRSMLNKSWFHHLLQGADATGQGGSEHKELHCTRGPGFCPPDVRRGSRRPGFSMQPWAPRLCHTFPHLRPHLGKALPLTCPKLALTPRAWGPGD